MGWDKKTWRQGVATSLFEIASIPLQQDLWQGKIKGYCSYFDDCVNLLDCYAIPEHLDDFVNMGFSSKEENPSHEIVWAEQSWIDFSKSAEKILALYFKDDLLESGEPNISWFKKISTFVSK